MVYLCISHFSPSMLYFPTFEHLRKHALIFFNSVVVGYSVTSQSKAILYNDPIQCLPNFLKGQRHREMIRVVQDIKLMSEANEIQVSNHMNFYDFRPHFLLVSGASERGAIFWNTCTSLVRHEVEVLSYYFCFILKKLWSKICCLIRPHSPSKTAWEQQSFMKHNREIINQKNKPSLKSGSASELEESALLWKDNEGNLARNLMGPYIHVTDLTLINY